MILNSVIYKARQAIGFETSRLSYEDNQAAKKAKMDQLQNIYSENKNDLDALQLACDDSISNYKGMLYKGDFEKVAFQVRQDQKSVLEKLSANGLNIVVKLSVGMGPGELAVVASNGHDVVYPQKYIGKEKDYVENVIYPVKMAL